MTTDPIADFLTRIRNGLMSKHAKIACPSSKLKVRLADILQRNGYISSFDVEHDGTKQKLVLSMKYDHEQKPVIEGLKRVSKPGLRVYLPSKDVPKVRGGQGMAVLSTSRGVMTDAEARAANVGGEVLCYIW